jgi:hypothetical protein
MGMRKADYAILAEAIKKHGIERSEGHCYYYFTKAHAEGARQCAETIARTFARFAHVDRAEFLRACGIGP